MERDRGILRGGGGGGVISATLPPYCYNAIIAFLLVHNGA